MKQHRDTAQVLRALELNIQAQISWLKECQILSPGNNADGAITRYPDQGAVTPYFANFAALAMLEEPACYPLAERYLDWYLRHIEGNGTILDYQYDRQLNAKTSGPDSEDAYAGTYLWLVARYLEKTGRTRWATKNLQGLKRIAGSIIRLMDRDGLTFALASYKVKYLMDNCEVYRGLADFAQLLDRLGDKEAGNYKTCAKTVAAGIENSLWNPRGHYYYPSKTGRLKAGVNLKIFYPDAACQPFPALYGLIEPKSERAASLYRLFNDNHSDWITIKPPDYPWSILGYYACLHGDYRRAYGKLRFVRDEYIGAGSGNWFCAEAAYFVLTCARLLEKRNEWALMRNLN